MYYIFVVNGRESYSHILPDVKRQLEDVKIDHEFYVTKGPGDGTRFVRLYCDFHKTDEVCFVACGGSGTTNEVATALIGTEKKTFAVLAYGVSNDFLKCFPGRDFHSLKALVEDSEVKKIDAVKYNDDYSINVANIGFDAIVAHYANLAMEDGKKNAYGSSLVKGIIGGRYNRMKVVVDGVKINNPFTLLCIVANGRVCGSMYNCAPKAEVDDGFVEVCYFRSMSLLMFLLLLPKFIDGTYLDHPFYSKLVKYRRARHIEISSKDLIRICLDGEDYASTNIVIDVLEKALNFRMPKPQNN